MEERVKNESSENLIDIFEVCTKFWKEFRRIWWIILLVISICVGSSVLWGRSHYQKQYEASASFIVSSGGNGSLSGYYNKVTMDQLSTTFPYILTSGILNQIVANDLGMDFVPGSISASVLEETNLFQISVVSSTGQQAYDVLQSVTKNYSKVAKYVLGDITLKLVDETGVPEAPIAQPNYKGMIIKGLFAGLVISFFLLLVAVLTRNTVRNQEDIKRFLNVKYLAGIPQEQLKKRSKQGVASLMIDTTEVSYVFKEALNTLQIRLRREMKAQEMQTLLVTSTLAGEGKTTIACNLAYMMASKGYKVLLLDADFRNPSVASTLHLEAKERGFEDFLAGAARPEEVLCQYGESNLWVMPVLKPQEKVARYYRRNRFKSLIEHYKKEMDIILIDTPPCGIMNDAALAAESADGVLLVIRQDYAQRSQILEGIDIFSGEQTPLVGCVINGEETGMGSYGYGKYGYGKYGYGRYGYGKYGYGKYGYGEKEEER